MTMRFTPLAGIVSLCAAAFCAFAPAPASAQGSGGARDGVYVVSGVRVDATAANAAEAQTQAFAMGHRLGFERLVQRITVADELTRLGMPRLEQAALERLVSSIAVDDERRSGTRYIGRMTLRFQPAAVQNVLRGAGLTVVDTRGPPVLVVPLVTAVTPEAAEAWRVAWERGGYEGELQPLAVAPRSLVGAPDWVAASRHAQGVGAARAVYLDLRASGPNATVSVVEVGPGGLRRDLGAVQGRLGSGDAVAAGAQGLADQVSARLQTEWKTRVAANSGQRARVSASAIYSNRGEWDRIKTGLERAASTVISEIRIEAVARQGALVSFSYIGDRAQLAAELRRHGVSVEESSSGPVLRAVR
jgi:hypothetical protein